MSLKKRGFTDNPFDVIQFLSNKLAHSSLFLANRYNNEHYGNLSMSSEFADDYIQEIQRQFELLDTLSEEELEICRQTAFVNQNSNEYDMIQDYSRLENNLPTTYSKMCPHYPLEFEKILFGEDSDEYKRRRQLDYWLEHDFSLHPKEVFYSVLSLLKHDEDYCISNCGWTESYCEVVGRLQYDYDLTEDDINYILEGK